MPLPIDPLFADKDGARAVALDSDCNDKHQR